MVLELEVLLLGLPFSNSAANFSAPQDTVSVHRPGFYAERFQRFMCNTVFKKVPCKWLCQTPKCLPYSKRWGDRTPLSGNCQSQRPLLLYPHTLRAAAHPYVSHCVCPTCFVVTAFPMALLTCVLEGRGISGKLVGLQKICSC